MKKFIRKNELSSLSQAAATLGRKGGATVGRNRGASKRRGGDTPEQVSAQMRAVRAARRHYGIVSLPAGSRIAPDESLTVCAFRTLADRERWLALGVETDTHPVYHYLQTHGETRRAATRDEALEALREIMPGADARSLAEVASWPSTSDEAR